MDCGQKQWIGPACSRCRPVHRECGALSKSPPLNKCGNFVDTNVVKSKISLKDTGECLMCQFIRLI
jgi:hypothetical protein